MVSSFFCLSVCGSAEYFIFIIKVHFSTCRSNDDCLFIHFIGLFFNILEKIFSHIVAQLLMFFYWLKYEINSNTNCWFSAFSTRLFSVLRFESVIHEFDPYFNYRTTRFLAEEGFYSFHNWFDDRAWYPLGRSIGGTIYPGMKSDLYVLLHSQCKILFERVESS